MPLDKEVAGIVRKALPEGQHWYAIYSRIVDAVPKGEEEKYRALVWAFGYDLVSPEDHERRDREGSPFGAWIETEQGRIPPRLADVPEADVETWADAFAEIDDTRLRARIGDLLWERKHQPRPDQKGRAACVALVELATDHAWEPMEATEGLVRALEIASSLSDAALGARVVEAMRAAIEKELDSDEDRPGIPFSLLRPLVDLAESQRPETLPELIARTEQKYGADPHHVETALDLKIRIAPPEAVAELRRQQVRRWRDAAAQAAGILKATFLERALDTARTHGLTDEANEIRVELGSMTEEDLDLKTLSADFQVDRDLVEKYLESFVRFDTWQDSLTRFGLQGPPGGEPEEVEGRVTERIKANPFPFLVTKVVIDPDSAATIFRAADDPSHRKAATAQERLLAARIWSGFAIDVLRRFEHKYGRPKREDLAAFFTAEFIDEGTADRIARAFELWWESEFDESAHILAPRLEAILRNLARQLGLPIIREPVGDKPGGVRSLGHLFSALEGRLPTLGWHAYLFNLLSDPLGLNLRNVIAHGLRPSISAEDAALLLHAACFLRLTEPKRESA